MDNNKFTQSLLYFRGALDRGLMPRVGLGQEERRAAVYMVTFEDAEWCDGGKNCLRRPEISRKEVSRDTKPTNPKDEIASSSKVPLHLWPQSATIHGALALLAGRQKYGRSNWREAGVRATVYKDALDRHMGRWFEGEDNDDETGLSHLGHALACIAILVDARESGKFVDDRQFPGPGQAKLLAWAGEETKRLIALYADRPAPKHFSRLTEGESGAPETEQL